MQYRTHRHAHIASSAVRKTSITRVVSAVRTHTQTVRHTRTYVISILRPPLLTICNIIIILLYCFMNNVMRAYNIIYDPVDARRPRTRWLYYYCYTAIPSESCLEICTIRILISDTSICNAVDTRRRNSNGLFAVQHVLLLCMNAVCPNYIVYDAQQLLRLGVYVYIDCINYNRHNYTYNHKLPLW